MNVAYEQLVQHLQERDVKYRANEDTRVVSAEFQGEVGNYRLMATVDEDGELFQVLAMSPVLVPKGARPLIAEALVRANYGLVLGKFEMDFEDGELRFQIGQVLTGGELPDDVIERSFGAAMAMLDRYLPAFLSVIYGNELPKDAIRNVEGETSAAE